MRNKKRILVLFTVVVAGLFAMNLALGARVNVAEKAFEELWVDGNKQTVKQYFAKNYDGYYVGLGTQRGPEGARDSFETYHEAFSDLSYTVEHVLNKDDKTAIVWNATGVHTGEIFGIAPTNIEVAIQGVAVYRVVDGRIVEGGQYWHTPGLLNQLQQLPPQAVKLTDEALEAAAMSAPSHELIGIQEALNQTDRQYSASQTENLATVGDFIMDVCVEPQSSDLLAEKFSDNFVDHAVFDQMQQGATTGSEQVVEAMAAFSSIFPSAMFIDDMFAVGDFVVVQNSLDMTQQLEVFGVKPGADQNSFLSQRVDVMRLENGKIAEHWSGDDMGIFYHLDLAQSDR